MSERNNGNRKPRERRTADPVDLVNTGTTPVVYDADGRVLPAGERRTVKALDVVGLTAVERGYLTAEKPAQEDPEPAGTDSGDPESGASGASTRD